MPVDDKQVAASPTDIAYDANYPQQTETAVIMNEQSIFHRMEQWGFFLLPKSHPKSPGYTGLLVAIRKEPTEMHFDPASLHVRLSQKELAVWNTLGLRPASKKSVPVCPGRVILLDHKGKETEFFTFGGSLEALAVPGETVYSLRSPAPILTVTSALESAADQFTFETEDMLARYAAQWGLNQEGFDRRLARVDAAEFYFASLQAILLRLEQSRTLREVYHHLYCVLIKEKKWLEDTNQWPFMLISLDELCAADEIRV